MLSCRLAGMGTTAPEPGPTPILALKLDPDVALVLHRAKYATCRTKKDLVQAAILQMYGEGQQAT